MGLSLSAMGVHKPAQSALERIRDTQPHTHMVRGHRLIVCLTFTSSLTEENSFHSENQGH